MSALIVANDLTKTYRLKKRSGGWLKSFFAPETAEVVALDEVSFSIAPGELVGYIGPNGAGKSTTVKILSGILTPDGGQCSVLGMTPWQQRQKVVARIGVVFGQRSQLWWDLPVDDSFSLIRDIYKVQAKQFQKTREELIERLSLSALMNVPVRQLSLGQRMRCEIAASLLHSPDLLFLDEPTIGLDAVSKLALRAFIKEQNRERGMTVILTTHDMDDVEAMCSRVLLIGNGKILMDGPVDALLRERHERRMQATLGAPLDKDILPECVRATQIQAYEWRFEFDPEVMPAAQLIALLNDRCGIDDIIVEHPPIDEVVARRYEDMAREVAQ